MNIKTQKRFNLVIKIWRPICFIVAVLNILVANVGFMLMYYGKISFDWTYVGNGILGIILLLFAYHIRPKEIKEVIENE